MHPRAFHRARTTPLNPSKGLVRAVAFALAGLVVAGSAVALGSQAQSASAISTPARQQAPQAITCTDSTGILVSTGTSGSDISTATVTNGTFAATKVGMTNELVNAVGYNPNDGLIYGATTSSGGTDNQMVAFDLTGGKSETYLGVPTLANGTAVGVKYDAGVITSGNTWIGFARDGGNSTMTKIVLPSTPTQSATIRATQSTLTGATLSAQPRDVSFNPYDGLMYALMPSGSIYSITTTGVVTKVATTPSATANGTWAGGSWTDSFGNVFFYQNGSGTTGRVYQFNPTTKAITDVGAASAYGDFDATACLPIGMQKTVSPSTITPTSTATFTFTLANPYASDLVVTDFADTLAAGSGLTWKTVTPNGLFPDSAVTKSGASLTVTPITIPGGTRASFTATATITNPTASGSYTNQSSLMSKDVKIRSDDPAQAGASDATPFTVDVPAPTAIPDTPTTTQDTAVTFDPTANDERASTNAAIDPTQTVLVDGSGTAVSSLTTADGAYAVDATSGLVTFTPKTGFTGTATAPVTYRIQDVNHATATSTITPTVTPYPKPTANPDQPTTTQNTAVTFTPTANDTNATTGGGTIVAAKTVLIDSSGAPVTTLTTDDGSYTVDTATGSVVFTPAKDVTGTAKSPVTYRITDSNGATATSTITPVVTPYAAPTAKADTPTTEENTPVTFDPAENDTVATTGAAIDPTKTTLLTADGTAVRTLTTADGEYEVDGVTGRITFTPAENVTGTATVPVRYRITDANGATATATIIPETTPVTPSAIDDSATTDQGSSVTFDIVGNDVPGNTATAIDPSSVRFPNDEQTITTDEGTFTVDATGSVTFTPTDPGFVGTASTPYTVAGVDGRRSEEATATVTITPVAPVATDNTATTAENTALTVDVIGDDRTGVTGGKALDPTSVEFGELDGATRSADGKELSLPGVGTWTVDATTGIVSFSPATDHTGTTPAVPYTVADGNGTRSNTATLVVTITAVTPIATPDTATTTQGTAVEIPVLRNDAAGNEATPLTRSSVTLTKGGSDGTVSDDGKELVVDGEGTYTVGSDGIVTFAPVPSFTGTATPIGYTVSAQDGRSASSTITPTVTAVAPRLTPDAGSGTQGRAIVVDPLDNDRPGVTGGSAIVPSTLTLQPRTSGGTVSDDGRTLTITGVGVFTADGDGIVTFTPATGEDGPYSGEVPTIGYTVADTAGATASSTIDIAIDPTEPVANADSTTTPQSTPVALHPLDNDLAAEDGPALDPDSLVLSVPADAPAGTVLGDDGSLTIPGVGTFAITSTTGASRPVVTFTPVDGFTGTAVAGYTVRDGNRQPASSTMTVEVTGVPPVAAPDSGSTTQDTPVTVDLLGNDRSGAKGGAPLDPSSVVLETPATGGTRSEDGKQLVVDGVGTWTVDGSDGSVTFTPAEGFASTEDRAVPDVGYTVTDTDGRSATSTLSLTVTAVLPVATDDAARTDQGAPVTLQVVGNDRGGNTATPIDPTSVAWVRLPDGATLSDDGATLTVPGEGSYAIDGASGDVMFTPFPAFSGAATPVRYRVADVDGGTTTAVVRVTVTPVGPRAADDTATLEQNTTTTIPVLQNDREGIDGGTKLVAASVVFTAPPAGAVVDADGKRLVVPGQGTYTIDPVTGVVTFASATRTGALTPVTYAVTDEAGETSTATLTVTVTPTTPAAVDDAASTEQDLPVVVRPVANDRPGNARTPLVAAAVVLGAVGDARPADGGKSLVVPGEGTYVVSSDGNVTFTPERGYHGTATAVPYTIADAAGNTTQATIVVTVTPVVPGAAPDVASTRQGRAVTLTPLSNDTAGAVQTPLDRGSVRLTTVGLPAGAVLGTDGRTLTVPGEGTYTVDTTTGTVRFVPVPSFTGRATVVTYSVADVDGQLASATIAVSVTSNGQVARPDVASTGPGQAVTIDPMANDTAPSGAAWDPRSVLLVVPAGMTGATLSADQRTLTVPGQGVWTVDPDTGLITFTPAAGFAGTATAIEYSVADVDGVRSVATVTVTVTGSAAASDDPTGPVADVLAFTGSDPRGTIAIALALLLGGAALGLRNARRSRRRITRRR